MVCPPSWGLVSLVSCLPACFPACLPACLAACSLLGGVPAFLTTCLPACLPSRFRCWMVCPVFPKPCLLGLPEALSCFVSQLDSRLVSLLVSLCPPFRGRVFLVSQLVFLSSCFPWLHGVPKPCPPCLPTCLPTCFPTCLPTRRLACLPA